MGDFGDDLGKQIERSVNSSVSWINDVINDIHAGTNTAAANMQRNVEAYQQAQQERARVQQERARAQAERQRQLQERTKARQEYAKKIGNVGNSGNVGRYISAGFLVFFSAVWLENALQSFFVGSFSSSVFQVALGVLAGFGAFSQITKSIKLNRYAKYVNIIGDQNYVNISDFESTLGYSHSKVIKDLRGMISCGILKQGHIDSKEKYLMVTNEVYNQYLDAQSSYDARQAVQNMADQEKEAKERAAAGERDPELVKALEQGRDYIRQIKSANDKIPGEDITKKLDRLEQISSQIFEAVDKHPEKLPEIRKFMDYYMPTTLKLVNSYYEFDNQPVQGDNITKAKREIEDTLDMINMAFENLSDRLYEADTMDVKADISVLKTLLAQEGLKGNDFELK